ncbi:hypothetical protein [uncultured Paludibaculum sp.]|uniref:hypothetical protein n=1 Tax=uncultured Paludibaculum sp. TaxID=1765020 RepID=UPI002AAB33C6|nr:hypothetical protein [uncultured Paludibaculum sp.]
MPLLLYTTDRDQRHEHFLVPESGLPHVVFQDRAGLRGSANGQLPSEQEVVTAAEVTTTGLKQPEDGLLQEVANANTPVLDGPAVRAPS